jgi:hypothetical protein
LEINLDKIAKAKNLVLKALKEVAVGKPSGFSNLQATESEYLL